MTNRRLSDRRLAIIRRHLTGDRYTSGIDQIVARMIQEIDALTEALAKYGDHLDNCDSLHPFMSGLPCDCGWDSTAVSA